MRPKIKSFNKLVNQNRQAIKNDQEAMNNVEKKMDQRIMASLAPTKK
ncbi:FbpB family small basic protein [Pontibacillus litoralis]|uniref:FbpB family small basic protein n=1 Tax=Pontibacillus litoralis JSM 072002 TaxID=1385512 RepID=A0A0A5G4F3_9BACI|nr:FbpB family small basic protein [Pontibacillus litoralis]KGX86939.1 hypothetical protein N784_03310 [Pontibacillus litoralis JSM 072002]